MAHRRGGAADGRRGRLPLSRRRRIPCSLLLLFVGIRPTHPHGKLAYYLLPAFVITSLRLVWQGNLLAILFLFIGWALYCMSLRSLHIRGRTFFSYVACLVPSALMEIPNGVRRGLQPVPTSFFVRWLSIGIPLVVCGAFAFLFTMANPDASRWSFQQFELLAATMGDWLKTLHPGELFFLILVGTLSAGFLAPSIMPIPRASNPAKRDPTDISKTQFLISRNTLVAVNVLFVCYLIAEFLRMWNREFPAGFYYSGFAHQGAAWLTVALATTTLVLSAIFQSNLRSSNQLGQLHRLASVWLCLNVVLAIATYHRLMIYIGYNGLTHMRIVGMLGISSVVIGLFWTAFKIRHFQPFPWLVKRQLLTLLVVVFIYAVIPVDMITHAYNARRVGMGQLAPIVQITEHPVSAEGWLSALPLIHNDNDLIQSGIRAMMADRLLQGQKKPALWQKFQWSNFALQRAARQHQSQLEPYLTDRAKRDAAIQNLRQFAYQWY
jgi:hypothetical protein